MKAPFSAYLNGIAPAVKSLVSALKKSYDYVSVLSTDSVGFRLAISQRSKSFSNTNMTTERGNVVRVCRDGLYAEYAFNEFDPNDIGSVAEKLKSTLDAQLKTIAACGVQAYKTGILPDEKCELFVEKEAGILPENVDAKELVDKFTGLSDKGMASVEGALDFMLNGTSTHISKMFISPNRFLRQSYVYTEGSFATYAPDKNGELKMVYDGVSGCGGAEILNGLEAAIANAPTVMADMVNSEKMFLMARFS